MKPVYIYKCNAGRFEVELIKKSQEKLPDGKPFTAEIRLLEEVPFKVGKKSYKHKVGTILHVGAWQITRKRGGKK